MHLYRLIKTNDLDVIFVAGPGRGSAGLVANTYLDGSYTEFFPAIERDRHGFIACSKNSPGRAAYRVMLHLKPRALSMKVEISATRWLMLMVPRSTIATSSSPALSATANPRPDHCLRMRPATSGGLRGRRIQGHP